MDPDDRRAVKIKLTPAGIEASERKKGSYQYLSGLIDYLGEEESEQFADLLIKSITILIN